MNRLFSIRRRRPHIVDIDTPKVYGQEGYRFLYDTNFDGAFATALFTATNIGFIDDAVDRGAAGTFPVTDKVRVVFDPDTYSIDDTKSFWLKFVPVVGGVAGTPGAATLVLPSTANHGIGDVVIDGVAPNGTMLQIDLPLVQDLRFTNLDAGNNLLVATEDGGPTTAILPEVGEQTVGIYGTQGTIYVGGSGGTVAFSASFTLAFPR